MNNEKETMRSEYDFSNAKRNPYIGKLKPYNRTLTVNVSSKTFEKAKRLGEDYRSVFGKLLDKAVEAYSEAP